MARTTDADVRAIIDDTSTISTTIPIRTANVMVNWIASTCDAAGVLNADQLTEIETWLAAHYYAIADPQYIAKATDGASATFQGQTGMRLSSTFWGQQAISLDVTGCLASRDKGSSVGLAWLGKPPSTQIDYEDRD
jgi:hypothetical protein